MPSDSFLIPRLFSNIGDNFCQSATPIFGSHKEPPLIHMIHTESFFSPGGFEECQLRVDHSCAVSLYRRNFPHANEYDVLCLDSARSDSADLLFHYGALRARGVIAGSVKKVYGVKKLDSMCIDKFCQCHTLGPWLKMV